MRAENVKIPNEFDDENDMWKHPVCKTYESNREGVVRNIFTKNVVGYKEKDGYFRFACRCCDVKGKIKHHYIHRFTFECYFGLIEDGKVIDHINNIKSDNRLENLQMLTQKENCKKDYKKRDLKPKKIMAINVKTGETFIYKSQNGAAVDLGLEVGNIPKVLKGLQKTILSKKYDERFTFRKVDSRITPPVIIIKNKVNIPIDQVRKMIVNNSN